MAIKIKRARRAVQLCTDLALYAEYDRAVATLDAAQKRDGQTINPSAETKAAADAVQDIEAQMQAATLTFELEAQRRDVWEAFEAAHPPREGNDTDRQYTIDLSSLDSIIAESITSVEDAVGAQVGFQAEDWADLADEISTGQWQKFALAVLTVNRGVVAAPFSRAAGAGLQSTRASATA